MLGDFHEHGRGGLDADVDEAVRLYKLAAASGDSEAVDALRQLGFSPAGVLVCCTCFALPPTGTELQRCSGCKEAHYCGAACQRADWGPRHKDECKAWRARQAAQKAAMVTPEAAQESWVDRPLAELRKAADKGDAAAQADPVLAVQWMRRAVELRCTAAQCQLGAWFMLGEVSPLPANYKEALRLSRLAAEMGQPVAICNLGVLFTNGDEVPRDLDEACRLYRQAITLGFEPAKDKLRALARTGHAPVLAAVRELGLGSH